MEPNPANWGEQIELGKYYEGNSLIAKIKRNVTLLVDILKLAVKQFHKDDVLFFLIPYNLPFHGLFYRVMLRKDVPLYFIMIDLTKARDKRYSDELEKKLCKKARGIIVQTPQMKEAMLNDDYISEDKQTILISHFWPILTKEQAVGTSSFGTTIAFSGSLFKAPFAAQLADLDKRLSFTIDPNFRMITEDWGLVWDGNSTDTCDGRFGQYMKMVYPYKASLYLASNRPIIVWDKCAIAKQVKENHLGVVVSDLHNIYDAISSVDEEEKELIRLNVAKWCTIIRNGTERIDMMKQMLNQQ